MECCYEPYPSSSRNRACGATARVVSTTEQVLNILGILQAPKNRGFQNDKGERYS